MHILSSEQMKNIDRRATERFGIPSLLLMPPLRTKVPRRHALHRVFGLMVLVSPVVGARDRE